MALARHAEHRHMSVSCTGLDGFMYRVGCVSRGGVGEAGGRGHMYVLLRYNFQSRHYTPPGLVLYTLSLVNTCDPSSPLQSQKSKNYSTRDSHVVTHHSTTNLAILHIA